MKIKRIGAALALTLTLAGCANGAPDVAGAAVAAPATTSTTTVTRTVEVTPTQCREALDLAYEVIKEYGELTQLNVDIMQDLFDKDWTGAERRMDRALAALDPINSKKIKLAGLGVYCS